MDYRKEMNELQKGLASLDTHITARLVELAEIHPDAVIIRKLDDDIKAKCLTKNWVESLSMEMRVSFIEAIEKWSSERNNVRQLEIKE